ncbi:ribonuclease R [Methylohalomonas lacus]|uniref:Ribonuclease R n=1 Tax=Methylohalomonas lacus TaxID=398773 RepID=A0AAE3HL12_9GAMM|nr:ribonuclease R [Methylohalomonas lacus]MCS3902398.1 ribonuclease R [Methylohalomonas lacus]
MSTRKKKKAPQQGSDGRRETRSLSLESQQRVLDYLREAGKPRAIDRLAADLELDSDKQRQQLEQTLGELVAQGIILRNRRDQVGLADKMDLIRGRIIGHPDGFGFLVPDQGGEDLYMSPREMRTLLHGDRILASVAGIDRRGRRLGALVEVLERANQKIVGRYFHEHGIGFVSPDNRRINQDILIPPEHTADADHGQFVVAEITAQPEKKRQPLGKIVKVLGDHLAPGMAVEVAIHAFSLPHEWPAAVEREAAKVPDKVSEQEYAGREDLRAKPLVTIDGEDARDFDDAVYCERDGDGWRLWVCIADVSHYVKPDSALDNEARQRGNSVYFPGQVIPMLPEVLSNEICSLKPEVERLCMACEMQVDSRGEVTGKRFYPAVMRSAARLTYSEVGSVLAGEPRSLPPAKQDVIPHLENLYALYQLMHARREHHGLLEFASTETKLVFNEDGHVDDVIVIERNDAHRIIEEFMLAANVATGEFLTEQKIPTLYRVHDTPKEEKLEDLRKLLGEMGITLGGGDNPDASDYARVIEQIQGRENAHTIETVLLRSMPMAVYSPENLGHFGLNFPVYAHFTSPIRRYPDLLVHRGIRHALAGKPAGDFDYGWDDMQTLGDHCSMTERRADEATRDAILRYKCEFMRDRIGEAFDAIITGVTNFGIFVEMADVYTEGLVHVTALRNDYYHFDPVAHQLTGERSGRTYRLADRVRVRVMRVDVDERKIDLELADSPQKEGDAGKAAKPAQNQDDKTEKKKKKRRRRKRKRTGKKPDADA